MSKIEQVEIPIRGTIDFRAAETYVSRIRAALSNGIRSITLQMGEATAVSSGEFIAYVATVGQFLRENEGELVVVAHGTLFNWMKRLQLRRFVTLQEPK